MTLKIFWLRKKRGDIRLISIDCNAAEKKAIEEGKQYGALCQNPYTMGYVAITSALHAAAGEKIDQRIDTGYIWVDAANIDAPEVAAYMID